MGVVPFLLIRIETNPLSPSLPLPALFPLLSPFLLSLSSVQKQAVATPAGGDHDDLQARLDQLRRGDDD